MHSKDLQCVKSLARHQVCIITFPFHSWEVAAMIHLAGKEMRPEKSINFSTVTQLACSRAHVQTPLV